MLGHKAIYQSHGESGVLMTLPEGDRSYMIISLQIPISLSLWVVPLLCPKTSLALPPLAFSVGYLLVHVSVS